VASIILVTEMAGSSAVLLPMLMACFVAMQVPTMLGGAPLSETLRARTLKIQESITAGGGARQDNISRETLPSRKFEHWRDDRFFFFARVWRYPSSSCVGAHTAASI